MAGEWAFPLLLLVVILFIVFVRRSIDGSSPGTLMTLSAADQPSHYSRLIADVDRERPDYTSVLEGMEADLWHRSTARGEIGSTARRQRIRSYLDAFSADVRVTRSSRSISERHFLELARRHSAAISMMGEEE